MTARRVPEPDQASVLSRSRVLAVMGSYFLLTGVLQAFIPLRASFLGADGAAIGLLLVLAGGGIGLLTDMGFGSFADAYGRDKVVLAGFVCILAAVSLIALDGSVVALFLGCFLAGLGNSAVFDPLLALLTTTRHRHAQAWTQGFNVTIQRCGALLAALMIGVSLVSRHDDVLVLTAVVACLAPLVVIYSRSARSWSHWRWPFAGGVTPLRELLSDGYRQGIKMFRRRRIVLAALVSVAVNLIFIETNSFVPLIDRRHDLRQALVITAALAARDLVAIAVGVFAAATGRDTSSPKVVAGVLFLAALSAAGVGFDAAGSHWTLILWCGLQGAAIGVGIGAMNLLTIGASSESRRALGMAAATVLNRLGVIVIPMSLGFALQLQGLRSVFFAVGATLTLLGLVFLGLEAGAEGEGSRAA